MCSIKRHIPELNELRNVVPLFLEFFEELEIAFEDVLGVEDLKPAKAVTSNIASLKGVDFAPTVDHQSLRVGVFDGGDEVDETDLNQLSFLVKGLWCVKVSDDVETVGFDDVLVEGNSGRHFVLFVLGTIK